MSVVFKIKQSRDAHKAQMTGMLGVYLTAVELTKLGFIVSPTSRSALGADLLVTDQECKKAWSVQVKTNAKTAKFWLTSEKAKSISSKSHIYVFVNARRDKGEPEFYVVPSRIVAKTIKTTPPRKTGSIWHSYWKDEKYRDAWKKVFGEPKGPTPAKLDSK
ncbi:MAG TPA: hypothetical protein VGH02_03270 [Rhizomicrobium sp.]